MNKTFTILFSVILICFSITGYSQVNLTQGLMAYYPFTGNANDVSGNNNNPSFNNATLTTDRFGNANSAYHFNGVNNYMQIPNAPTLNSTSNISLVVWVRATGFNYGICHGNRVMHKGSSVENDVGNYEINFDDSYKTSGQNCFINLPDTTHEAFDVTNGTSNQYIQKNQWYCVIVTNNGSITNTYINCQLIDSKSSVGLGFTTPSDLFFGHFPNTTFPYWLNGDLDDIRIYNRALTIDEVNAIGGCNTLTCNNWLSTPSDQSYVDVGNLNIPGNQITVEATINRTQPYVPGGGDGSEGDVVSKHRSPTDVNYLLRANHAYITTTNGFFATPDICDIQLNKTYHVAMTYDGVTLKFYRDGFLMSQIAATGNLIQNSWTTRIGRYSGAVLENFIGDINEVRIWNVARTQAQIQANLNSSLPSPSTQLGLQAYYIFDNLSNKQGNAAWDGTLGGAATINATNINCNYVADSCAVDPCTNWLHTTVDPSYVTVGDIDVVGSQVTVEATVNRTPLAVDGHVVSKHTGPSNINYALSLANCEITTTNGYTHTNAICAPDLNKTYHIAMVYNGSSLKFYRNGFLMDQVPCTGNLINNDLLTTIGQVAGNSYPLTDQFYGYINEVRIWNVARTQTQLRTYMNTSLPSPTTQPGLLAYYTFDNLSNKQGNAAFNGTIGGAATINAVNPNCNFIADSCGTLVVTTTCTPTFQKRYGGNKDDNGNQVIANADGSMVTIGYTNSFGNGGYDGYMQKTDKNGNLIWTKTYGGTGNDYLYRGKQTPDGGYVAVGMTKSFGGNGGGIAWMVRTDANGNLLWSRKYDDSNPDGSIAWEIINTSDGGFAISGTNHIPSGVSNVMVIKTDNVGNPQWAKSFDNGNSDESFGIVEDADSLVVIANTNVGASMYNAIIMKLNRNNGAIVWAKSYDVEGKSNRPSGLYKTSNGYIIDCYDDIGFSLQQPETVGIRTDKNGNPISLYKVTDATPRVPRGFAPTSDNGFVVSQSDNNTNADMTLIKVSSTGTIDWTRKYGGTGAQILQTVVQATDGGYVLSGFNNTTPSNSDSDNIYLIKTDNLGATSGCTTTASTATISVPTYTVDPSFTWASIANLSFGTTSINPVAANSYTVTTTLCGTGINADFSYKQDVCNPLSAQFFAAGSSLNNPYWSFGDNTSTTGTLTPTHLYSATGNYLVRFTVDNPAGCPDTISKVVNISTQLANIILTNDTTICFGTTKQLKAQPSASFCWSPTTYLDNPALNNPTTSAPANITYFYTAEILGPNLIVNGDFTAGNTGFTSAYNYKTPNTLEGEYYVGPNPQSWNGGMAACSDHTTGSGNMMLVNGAPASNTIIWGQTVNITPNTNYNFTCWVQSVSTANPAQLQFSINNILIGPVFSPPGTTCSWQRFFSNWNSGANTTASISIVNQNVIAAGNDFALDDISFAAVTIQKDSVKISVDTPAIAASGGTTICAGKQAQLSASGSASYVWTPAAGLSNPNIANPLASPATNTTYTVTGTDAKGCSKSTSVAVGIKAVPVFTVSPPQQTCVGSNVQLTASGGNTYLWSPANLVSNAAIANPMVTATSTTNYSVTITESVCNVSTTLQTVVTINPKLNVAAFKSNDIDCSIGVSNLTAFGGSQYTWTPATGLSNSLIYNPVASPTVTTQYTVNATDALGCSGSDTVTVVVAILGQSTYSMPNSFTPNGDGLNDCFGIKYWGQIQDLQFSIYNRYGERVFYTTDPNKCWDGKYKTDRPENGSYVYYIKAKTACGTVERKGNVILMR